MFNEWKWNSIKQWLFPLMSSLEQSLTKLKRSSLYINWFTALMHTPRNTTDLLTLLLLRCIMARLILVLCLSQVVFALVAAAFADRFWSSNSKSSIRGDVVGRERSAPLPWKRSPSPCVVGSRYRTRRCGNSGKRGLKGRKVSRTLWQLCLMF